MGEYDSTAMGDALALVNVARQAFGLPMLAELPAATPGSSSDCVLARAFRNIREEATVSDSVSFGDDEAAARKASELWASPLLLGGHAVKVPEAFGQLISDFDGRRLPTLVDGS